jgi:diphthamide synthase (EF-2-diphthine--ammonia ligase)
MDRGSKWTYNLTMLFFRVVVPCRLISRYQTLKMETVCFSEMLVSTYSPTWHDNPEEQYYHPHHCQNLKTDIQFCWKNVLENSHLENKEGNGRTILNRILDK